MFWVQDVVLDAINSMIICLFLGFFSKVNGFICDAGSILCIDIATYALHSYVYCLMLDGYALYDLYH